MRSTTIKWKNLRHNGVAFPPKYEQNPTLQPIRIKNRWIKELDPLLEEMLMAWAKKIGTPYEIDPKFRENFLLSLRKAAQQEGWTEKFEDVTLDDIDFSQLREIADKEKLANKSEEERKQISAIRKKEREKLKEDFGKAEVLYPDKTEPESVEIGAYMVEPPGIFMGRGEHPLRGTWKRRVTSKDVELNLDEDAPRPKPMDGGEWKGFVHDHDGLWIARWKDELSDKLKYVWLAETSDLRQNKDKEKYFNAEELEIHIEKVLEKIGNGMRKRHNEKERDEKERKTATVAYLIYRTAMRVGDEKDEDEADTVGASTLRKGHVSILENRIDFDFLGKDSVPWKKPLYLDQNPGVEKDRDELFRKNLEEFMRGKESEEQIFPDITSARVNDFLKRTNPVKGLSVTAKMFRTFHATKAVSDYLFNESKIEASDPPHTKFYAAKEANLRAAIMCNHKRARPKTWEKGLQARKDREAQAIKKEPNYAKLKEDIDKQQSQLDKLRDKSEALKKSLQAKEDELSTLESDAVPTDEEKKKKYDKKYRELKNKIKKLKRQVKAKESGILAKILKTETKLEEAKKAPELGKKLYEEKREAARMERELYERVDDYALNTSLKNYIDPRVYRDWGKDVDYDWKKLYTGTLLKKFGWVDSSKRRRASKKRTTPREKSE